MLKKVQEPSQHFKAYYQENSILMQLMISEFFEIHQIACNIFKLEKSKESVQPKEYIGHLFQYLKEMFGESNDHGLSISRWSRGPMSRMQEYCEHFSRNSTDLNKPHLNLLSILHESWLCAKHNLELIYSLNSCYNENKFSVILFRIHRAVHSLLIRIQLTTKHLFNCLKTYNDDENVIFFLLRKKEFLIKIYGIDQFNQLLLFFAKNQNLASFLIKRFKARGFEQLLPVIKKELFLYESYRNFKS